MQKTFDFCLCFYTFTVKFPKQNNAMKVMKNHCCFILIFLMFSAFSAFSQCDEEAYTAQALKTLGAGFSFIKPYKIDGKGGTRKQIEYTCIMNKDNSYMIRIASKDGATNGIVATLYDSQRIELATNLVNNKFFNGWTFKCPATGVYYITFTFKDATSYCGAAVLGFKITK
jgi:hypothetical protein